MTIDILHPLIIFLIIVSILALALLLITIYAIIRIAIDGDIDQISDKL